MLPCQIVDELEFSVQQSINSIDSLASTIVSLAHASRQKFPFVTIPEYGVHVAKMLSTTAAITTNYVPVVSTGTQRNEWEQYSSSGNATKNLHLKKYLDTTIHIQDTWKHFYGPLPQNETWASRDVIYNKDGDIPYDDDGASNEDGKLNVNLPNWHTFPFISNSMESPANWGKCTKLLRTINDKACSNTIICSFIFSFNLT